MTLRHLIAVALLALAALLLVAGAWVVGGVGWALLVAGVAILVPGVLLGLSDAPEDDGVVETYDDAGQLVRVRGGRILR